MGRRHLSKAVAYTVKLLKKNSILLTDSTSDPVTKMDFLTFTWINYLWAKPKWFCYLSKLRDCCKNIQIDTVFLAYIVILAILPQKYVRKIEKTPENEPPPNKQNMVGRKCLGLDLIRSAHQAVFQPFQLLNLVEYFVQCSVLLAWQERCLKNKDALPSQQCEIQAIICQLRHASYQQW